MENSFDSHRVSKLRRAILGKDLYRVYMKLLYSREASQNSSQIVQRDPLMVDGAVVDSI
jgi:hypothetical protein